MKILLLASLALVLLSACSAAPQDSPGTQDPSAPTQASQAAQEPTKTMSPSAPPARANLPDLGLAPELTNQVWLNTAAPLRLADLRGQVVLLDMWTFG